MATIILSSVGSMFGPLGRIAGTLAGSAIDNALFKPDDIEGARLTELAVSGSSYGTPIARHYGTMRAPGTIVWSTDLQEHRDTQSNGKGKPKTATYSYSVSFAVVLSSRPIERVGRIWADGNLLRGAGGDLKSGGSLRVHTGHADQMCDPLMEAELGSACPAFRGCAYVVFEDLDLTDFGNRIPALNFEVVASDAARMLDDLLEGTAIGTADRTAFPQLAGFAYEGGSLRDLAQLVDRIHPLAPQAQVDGVTLGPVPASDAQAIRLGPPAAWDDGDFGQQGGYVRSRSEGRTAGMAAIRYYDPARDYQPGLQHTDNAPLHARTFQFPGAFSASDARLLAQRANRRAATGQERLSWRCAELDPEIAPGTLVTIPGFAGIFMVAGWEWRERGVELDLVRHRIGSEEVAVADPGSGWTPPDRLPSPTSLRVFETPWDGFGNAKARSVYAAAGAATGRWSGCALYAERERALTPLGLAARDRAVMGALSEPLKASSAMRFEPEASLQLHLIDHDAALASCSLAELAQGSNRLLVGSEVLQFQNAEPLGEGGWLLTGLLRGRGGTEIHALAGHATGAAATLLDTRLLALGENALAMATESFAAIGLGDEEPALAEVENAGASLRPPSPVHAHMTVAADGSLDCSWVRRARGQWNWPDEVDLPLVEEMEVYEVGFGAIDAPHRLWAAPSPSFHLESVTSDALLSSHGPGPFWVRQVGSFGKSDALLLGQLG